MVQRCKGTSDLFTWTPPAAVEIVAAFPEAVTRPASFQLRLVNGMKQALDEDGRDRAEIARAMGDFLGERVSDNALDAALSAARTDHVINVARYAALAKVVEDARLIALLAEPLGHVVVHRRFVPYVQLGMLAEARSEVDRRILQTRRTIAGGRS